MPCLVLAGPSFLGPSKFLLGRAWAGDFPIETAGLAAPATDSTADAKAATDFMSLFYCHPRPVIGYRE
jgi:hypothetical protein